MPKASWSKLMNAIIDEGHLAKMKGASPKVYMALLRHSDFDLKDVYPGIEKLCKLTGVKSRTSIKDALKNLSEIGLIHITKRSHDSKGCLTNLYSFEKFSPLEEGQKSDQGEGQKSGQGYSRLSGPAAGGNPAPNNTEITIPNTTTNNRRLKKRIIQEEYETEVPNLDDVVVAILKNLNIKESSWSIAKDVPPSRIQALEKLAKNKKNPPGFFIRALEDGWQIPGFDKEAFEIQCDFIRTTFSYLKSKKTGKFYEIIKYKTGDKVTIMAEDRGEVILDEKELEKFTYENKVA